MRILRFNICMPLKIKPRWLIWTPRILAIAMALFYGIFSFDVFDGSAPLWQKLLGFLIHSIPTFLMLGLTAYAWKRPRTGGIVFIVLSFLFSLRFRWWNNPMALVILGLPLIVIGVLFILSQEDRKKK